MAERADQTQEIIVGWVESATRMKAHRQPLLHRAADELQLQLQIVCAADAVSR